jgi:DNA-directed RNA polymerase specialized sigma24 family protein
MTLDPRSFSWLSLRSLRGLFGSPRRWSAGDVALSPAERYRRETELEDAIRTLPNELRTVFELSYWHDLVNTEIAEALGMPVGTVAARISRATEKLRHLMVVDQPLSYSLDV